MIRLHPCCIVFHSSLAKHGKTIMKKQVRRFTLIEFFVVVFVGAVVVLGLMFLPTIITLKERGRAAHCTSNLSQIGKAFFQYAMSYDDWYPTVRSYRTETVLRRGYTDPAGVEARMHERPIDGGKWLGADSYKAFTLLFDADLLNDPKDVICPGNKKVTAAIRGQSLSGHVSYQWCDGQVGFEAVLSPVAADGASNHPSSGYNQFVRGEGSVGHASGNSSMKWYEDKMVKDFCKSPNDLPDYSF
jgi:competence protein ComGC